MVRPKPDNFWFLLKSKLSYFGLEIFWVKIATRRGAVFSKKGTNLENICVKIVFKKLFAVQNRTLGKLAEKSTPLAISLGYSNVLKSLAIIVFLRLDI